MTDVVISTAIDATLASGTTRAPIAINFVSPVTMTVDSFKIWTLFSGQTVKGNIYARSGTTTTTPLGGDSAVTNTVAGGQLVITLSSPASLVSGGTYSVVLNQSLSTAIYGADSGSSINRYRSTALTAMTDPLPNPFASISTTGSNKFPYLILTSSSPTISSIDQCVTGQVSTINYSESFAATSGSITDTVITKTFALTASDADTSTGTIPQWVDGATCVKIGNVNITTTNGTLTTNAFADTYSMDYFHPDDATVVPFVATTLTSVAAEALAVTPAFQVGTQTVYDTARCTTGLDGVVEFDSYTGSTYFWYTNPDDNIARLVIIDTVDGEIVEVTMGLTAVGLTATGLTSRGLTMVGL